jgi:hypothetical protein
VQFSSGACPPSRQPHQLASGLFTKAELGPTQQPRVPVDVVIGLGLQSRSLEAVAPAVAAWAWNALDALDAAGRGAWW